MEYTVDATWALQRLWYYLHWSIPLYAFILNIYEVIYEVIYQR